VIKRNHRRFASHRLEHSQAEPFIARHHVSICICVEVPQVLTRQVTCPQENRSTVVAPFALPVGELESNVVLARMKLGPEEKKERHIFARPKLLQKCSHEVAHVLSFHMCRNCQEIESLSARQWLATLRRPIVRGVDPMRHHMNGSSDTGLSEYFCGECRGNQNLVHAVAPVDKMRMN